MLLKSEPVYCNEVKKDSKLYPKKGDSKSFGAT